jgi:hypothetical protein
VFSGLLAVLFTVPALAAETPAAGKPQTARELFVPFDDLHVLLQGQRVMLPRAEYERLLNEAAKNAPEPAAPARAILVAADYEVTVGPQWAEITGQLSIDVLADGLLAVPLELGAVGLRRAWLDDRPAPLGAADGRPLVVFVEGRGRHALKLDLVAPLETSAARQVLRLSLAQAPAVHMRLTAPGDVEIKEGAAVISRRVDEQAGLTRFELVPPRGPASVVMSLNSHLARQERLVTAKSFLVDEMTPACESLRATVSLDVFRRAVDQFRFAVPDGFDVLHVESPSLARWSIERDGPRRVLVVALRQPATEPVTLGLLCQRVGRPPAAWTFPRLAPLDVAGHAAVLRLVVDRRLRAESLAAEGLIPVDAGYEFPLPARQREAADSRLEPVAAYYAAQGEWRVSARFAEPPPRVMVTSSLSVALAEQGQLLDATLILVPEVEKLFAVDVALPADWQVSAVTGQGTRLPFESVGSGVGRRIRVALRKPAPPDAPFTLQLHAARTPADWLGEWQARRVDFPRCDVVGAAITRGTISVVACDDLTVRPERLTQLTPLNQRASSGAAAVAFRCEGPEWSAALAVERTAPRVTARTFSFARIEPDLVTAHFEIAYQVQSARTRRLDLLLPADTPKALEIRGLDGVKLKEYASREVAGGLRRWSAVLVEARRGPVRLAVDFQQPMGRRSQFVLPVVRADGVAYQSGLLAVEGSADLDVQVKVTDARPVDVGELADAQYQPGRRLLGAWGFVADRSAVTAGAQARVAQHPVRPLYGAIVEKATLSTLLSTQGDSVTTAEFRLLAKMLLVELRLPAGSQLWSATCDDKPLAPQRDGQAVLLSLPSGDGPRQLKIVYQTTVPAAPRGGWLGLAGPELLARPDRAKLATRIPAADLEWDVVLPHGYTILRHEGTVTRDAVERPLPAIVLVPGEILDAMIGTREYAHAPKARCAADGMAKYVEERPETPVDAAQLSTETLVIREEAEKALKESGRHPPRAAAKSAQEMAFGSNQPTSQPVPSIPPGMGGGMGGMGGMGPAEKPPAAARDPFASPAAPAFTAAEPFERAAPADAKAQSSEKKPLSLAGSRSLQIDTQQGWQAHGQSVRFVSLGDEPQLSIRLVEQSRVDTASWAAALAVLLAGLILTPCRTRVKARYVILAVLAATIVPLPLESIVLIQIGNAACAAALALVPYYLLVGLVRMIIAKATEAPAMPKAAATGALLVLLAAGIARAEPRDDLSGRLLQIFEPPKPVAVPDDVILVPYEPWSGTASADKLMVSYAKYVELWNRAYPDKKIVTAKRPADFALAGASYRATLASGEHLTLSGQVEIEVYAERFAAVPLGLEGAVLTRAVLDGKPAQIQSLWVEKKSEPQKQPTKAQAADPFGQSPNGAARVPAKAMVVLQVSGQGRHVLELELRVALERQGGWRVARATLPSAPASLLTLVVPESQTDLRLGNLSESATLHTERADQQVETSLAEAGGLRLQWRPKVSEARVDQTLKVHGTSTFDVEDEGLRLAARLDLEFRSAVRDAFRLEVPADYLIERIEGENVRGWELSAGPKRQAAEVQLLKPARDRETLRLVLVRRVALGRGPTEFELPVVEVEGAALADGLVVLRRSPTLDVRVRAAQGLVRTDLPGTSDQDPHARQSPLGLRPVQAYRFAATGYRLQLASEPIAARASAQVHSVLRISEFDREVETRVLLAVRDRSLHTVGLWVPDDLEIRRVVAPDGSHWAVESVAGRRLLSLYLSEGHVGELTVVVQGKLGKTGAVDQLALPRFEVRDVERQQGQIAVQVDPDYDIQPEGLENCATVLLEQAYAWLRPEQRESTRLAIDYRTPDYRGTLRLALRRAAVSCMSITNVRVTDRAIEETVLLEFTIRNAGVRELSFLLPASVERPRIQAPMLRQQTVEPVDAKPGSPLRVRLELQDPRMDKLLVLVENDRVLSSQAIQPPIPQVETGRTERQLVAVESAGRDEVVVERVEGLEPIGRQQKQWEVLARYLRGGATLAYQVSPGVQAPRLVLRTRDREAVQTVGARICLGETTLVLDAHGAYRASVSYRLDNSTEPYLTLDLPEGAELWTAHVAHEPVKPIHDPQKPSQRRVLVPLVKTALGDSDYPVVIQYAGCMPEPGLLRQVEFPLVRTVNIQVARSLLRLELPTTHAWFQFGDKMRLADAEEIEAERVAADTHQTERLLEIARHGDQYAKIRASSVLENLIPGLSKSMETMSNSLRRSCWSNADLETKLDQQRRVTQQAQEELRRTEPQKQQAETLGNRRSLSELYLGQQTKAARNVVRDQAANFDAATPTPQAARSDAFNPRWLERQQAAGELSEEKLHKADAGNDRPSQRKAIVGVYGGTKHGRRKAESPWPAAQAPVAAPQSAAKADKDTYARYREQLERRNVGQQAQPLAQQVAGGKERSAAAAQPSGLASLDVAIPMRGTTVYFTTPRGEVEMSAWAASERLLGYLRRSIAALAVAGLGLLLLRTTRRRD